MNTLLSIANAALQYHRGKQTGFAGLVGIGIALLIALQWDFVLPILHKLGIVGFFERNGLIAEDSAITGANILFFFFKLYIVVFILGVIALFLFGMIGGFLNSKIGEKVQIGIVLTIAFPFILLSIPYKMIFQKDKVIWTKEQAKEIKEKEFYELITPHAEELTKEQALNRLNRLPTSGDHHFLLGVTSELELYMLLPKPYHLDTANHKNELLACEKVWIEKYDEKKGNNPYSYVPKHVALNWRVGTFDKNVYSIKSMNPDMFIRFFNPSMKDYDYLFKAYTINKDYKLFIKGTMDTYFNRKRVLMEQISNELDKEKFDKLVDDVKKLNASNEDIVRIMWDEENQLKVN